MLHVLPLCERDNGMDCSQSFMHAVHTYIHTYIQCMYVCVLTCMDGLILEFRQLRLHVHVPCSMLAFFANDSCPCSRAALLCSMTYTRVAIRLYQDDCDMIFNAKGSQQCTQQCPVKIWTKFTSIIWTK